jgi:hypothetical protein
LGSGKIDLNNFFEEGRYEKTLSLGSGSKPTSINISFYTKWVSINNKVIVRENESSKDFQLKTSDNLSDERTEIIDVSVKTNFFPNFFFSNFLYFV